MKKIIAIIAFLSLLMGCASYKGGTIADGDTLQIGIKTPITSSGQTSLQILSWINGLNVSWEDNVNVNIKRTSIESSSAFGVWSNSKTNTTELVVTQILKDEDNERIPEL